MIGTLHSVVLDTADIKGLSSFYAELAGLSPDRADDDWITLRTADGHRTAFQRADDHLAPQWPDPAKPQQLHLDVLITDIDEAEPKVLALGGTRLPGGGDEFRVYADPIGHPFCLVW